MKPPRIIRQLVLGIGLIALAIGLVYSGGLALMNWRESASPSTEHVLVLRDGRQVSLRQPTPMPSLPAQATSIVAQPAPTPHTVLPPTQIAIPGLKLDWPVVLSTTEHLPRFKAVGWLMGSAAPGEVGNMVLFGHRGGQAETFATLDQLAVGDLFSVATADAAFRYQITESYETDRWDVGVLAPSDTATATLITCTGPWDAAAQTNERRLIIRAALVK